MKLITFAIQNTPIQLPGQISNVTRLTGLYGINIIRLVVNLIIFFGVFLTLGFVIYGGWKFLTSQGDKKAIEEARTTIIFSLIGLIVIAMSYLVINIIGAFFNVPILGK